MLKVGQDGVDFGVSHLLSCGAKFYRSSPYHSMA